MVEAIKNKVKPKQQRPPITGAVILKTRPDNKIDIKEKDKEVLTVQHLVVP